MAEYVYAEEQTVAPGQNVLLIDSISCPRRRVLHRNGSGILTLRGVTDCPCAAFARYKVEFNGNIAVPADETPGEISLALAISGEPLQTSKARVTPTATEAYFNVTSVAHVTVPIGCCTSIAVENTSLINTLVANANLVISEDA